MTRHVPLHGVHADTGASFTDFGGWEMPVEFSSIREEHAAVRESVGKFDVSHMGEIEVMGPDAERLMQRLTSNDVTALDDGDSQYAMITREDGVILDDTLVYRRRPDEYLFVPNAGHDAEMVERWTTHRDDWGLDATVTNRTTELAMLAVQGPDAVELVGSLAADPIAGLSWSEFVETTIADVEVTLSRTGYTGEDGVEIIAPWDEVEPVWSAIDCPSCGLGARDTLRMEMGYLLSGQEFDPEANPRNPYEAGVTFTVKLDTEFVGRDALEQADAEGVAETLVGFGLIDRGIARHGYSIESPDGDSLGTVTSGTMSPTIGEPIGLGYVPVERADPGTMVRVVVRGEPKKAKIRATPFIDR